MKSKDQKYKEAVGRSLYRLAHLSGQDLQRIYKGDGRRVCVQLGIRLKDEEARRGVTSIFVKKGLDDPFANYDPLNQEQQKGTTGLTPKDSEREMAHYENMIAIANW